jgi:DNA polymerase V
MEGTEEQDDSIVVHAGFPNPATDKSLVNLDLNQLLIQRPSSTYLFRISGNEWARIGIFDQDIAIVDRALSPRPREPVVWWNEEGQFSISAFKDTPPESTIWGVVTSVVHQFRKPSRG